MKKIFLWISVIFIFEGCNKESRLIDGSLLYSLNKKEISNIIPKNRYINRHVNYSYKVYKIIYKTKDFNGNDINASGAVSIPLKKRKSFNLVINCHPTIFLNAKAPTEKQPLTAAPIFSAKSGFITIEPDYIGFGVSARRKHLYFIKKENAAAVKDFTLAALEFLKLNQIKIKKIFLTGYSEGGFVALSALEELEKSGINIKLTIPIAGIYFLEPVAKEVLKNKKIEKPSIITAVALSYAKAYHLDISDILSSYTLFKTQKLFNGKHLKNYIDNSLPKKISGEKGLFKSSFISNYQDSKFQEALKENSAIDFIPGSSIRFLHCIGDDAVPYQLSAAAADIFKNYLFVSDVKLIPVEPFITQNSKTDLRLNHKKCAPAAYKIANFLFLLNSRN